MPEKEKPKPVSIFKLFRYASCLDWFLMFLGTIAAILLGSSLPIAMNVFGDITNAFVQYDASRTIATSPEILCPTSLIITITNFSSIVGGDEFTCGTMFTFTDPPSSTTCNFTIDTIQTAIFGSSSTCLDNRSFIDEINFQVYIFIGIALAAWLVGSIQMWFYQSAAEHQLHKIRLRLYGSMLKQDIAWFDANPTGKLASRISGDIDEIYNGIGDNLAKLIQSVTSFFAAIVVGFVREWRLALILLAIVPFMAVAAAVFTKLGSIFSSREQKEYASAGAVAEEVLSEVKTVFAFGGEVKETERYNSYLASANKSGFIKGVAVGSSIGSIYFLIFLVYSVSFWFGAFLVSRELAQPGDVITVFFAILVGAFDFGQAGPNIQNLVQALGAAGGIYEIIDRKPVIDALSEEGIVPDADTFKCDIEFKDVKFNYPTRPDTEVLKGLSLKVQNGETLAIVGGSGSGKTTVVELVQRFYDTCEGEVLIGGHNIKDLNLQWLRSKIGVVSQEPVLFNTTIAENIRYGKKEATMNEIEEAAKSANAHNFISSLPDGYDTVVGEDGDLLSGGQKQRIAIARALVRDPVILLLDEATSALDAQSERVVQNALEAACIGRTTFIVAHRLSTIRNATKIASIKDGVVSEIGTHEELMQNKGVYHELVTDQTYSDQLPRPECACYKRSYRSRSAVLRKSRSGSVSLTESVIRVAARTVSVRGSRYRRRTQSGASRYRGSSIQEEGNAGEKEAVSIELDLVESESRTRSISNEKSFKSTQSLDDLDDENEDGYLPDVSFFQLLRLSNRTMLCAMVFGTLAALIAGMVTPAFSIVFGEVIEVFGRPPDEVLSGTHVWGALFFGLGMLIALMVFIKHLCFSVSGETLSVKVRSLLFKSILRQDISWFDEERNSTITLTRKLAYDAGLVQGAIGIRVGTLVESLTGLVFALVVAFVYSWVLAFVIVGFMPLIALSSVLYFSLAAGTTRLKSQTLKDSTEIALESTRHIHTVATFGLEKTYYENYAKSLQSPYLWTLCLSPLFGITYGITQSIVFFGYIITFRFGAYQVTLPTDHIAYTEFQNVFRVFAAIIFGAIGIGAASSYAPDYKQAKLAAKRVFAIINREPIIDNYSEEGCKPKSTNGDIQMNSVFFSYPERKEVSVLKQLSLSVKSGKMLALVGSSGSGKSTIISLIERFYDPTAGNMTLDGIDFLDLNLHWLRSQIGIVSQEPVLFDCSIAENIRYGALFREVSDEEVIEAAKSANIHNFIESLPEGYNTKVGSKGTQLSGGQKQRVAIARALVRDPKVLLLDEATSALDTESEKIVQEALDKAREGRTSIVIAHRLSTIKNADCIAVMRGGQVTELGTHFELLAKKGLYYKLNQYQFGEGGVQSTVGTGAVASVTEDSN